VLLRFDTGWPSWGRSILVQFWGKTRGFGSVRFGLIIKISARGSEVSKAFSIAVRYPTPSRNTLTQSLVTAPAGWDDAPEKWTAADVAAARSNAARSCYLVCCGRLTLTGRWTCGRKLSTGSPWLDGIMSPVIWVV